MTGALSLKLHSVSNFNSVFQKSTTPQRIPYILNSEIINAGSGPANLDGVSLSDGVEFEFSIGTELAAGERIILSAANGC